MPKLTGAGMAANHQVSPDYCPGCGLHRYVVGKHREDCTLPEDRRVGDLA